MPGEKFRLTSIWQLTLVRMTGAFTTPAQVMPGVNVSPAVAPSVTLWIESEAPAPTLTEIVSTKVWPATVVVAWMTALPCATPVTGQTEVPADVEQVPETVAIVAVAFEVWPGARLMLAGEMLNTDDDVTVMLTAALRAWLACDVAMTVVVPRPAPVTRPVLDTVAMR